MKKIKDFEVLLKYLPIFKDKNFKVLNKNLEEKELPFCLSYSDEVNNFISDFYKSNLIYQFKWSKWQKEALEYFKNPELLKKADITTIQKLLTLHIRKERFCEGHLMMVIKSGHMVDILSRLYEIVKEKI